jgi:hypothetical protein
MPHIYRVQYFLNGNNGAQILYCNNPVKTQGVKEIIALVFPNAPPEQVEEIAESILATAKSDDDMAAVYHMPGAPYDGQSWITCDKLEVL